MPRKNEISIPPSLVRKIAKEIDPGLYHSNQTGNYVAGFKIINREDKDAGKIAADIAKTTETNLIYFKKGDRMSHIVFSLGPSLDKIKGVGRSVRENLEEDMVYKWKPSWTEANIKKLESEVESYILNMLKNCIENPQEIEKRISWP